MEFRYIGKDFSLLSPGTVFIINPESDTPFMKIKPVVNKLNKEFTAIRLSDGEAFNFLDTQTVYPLNCYLTRNI